MVVNLQASNVKVSHLSSGATKHRYMLCFHVKIRYYWYDDLSKITCKII